MNKVIKVAITGPESTGKSVLAEQLAGYFQTAWVPEFARSYLANLDRPYFPEDIVAIAKGQLRHEKVTGKSANGFLFCDTELIVTKIWSEFKYGFCDPWILKTININKYQLFLLCDVDLPWIDDPLREHPQFRKQLFELYFQELTNRSFLFRIVSGSGTRRFENALNAIREVFPDCDSRH